MEPVHTTIIAFAITLAVLIVLGIGISVKLYFDLVSDIFRRYKIAVG
jgi:hypothetical protein